MKIKTLFTGTFLVLALTGQAVWACATCGCQSKKTEDETAAKKSCGTCATATSKKACATKRHAHKHKTIDTSGLKEALESKAVIVLDARSGKFDDGRRIPGAKQLSADADDKSIKAKAGADKTAKIVTYCSSLKCGASAKLAKRLRKEGYTNVIEYPVGIAGWVEGGNKIEKK